MRLLKKLLPLLLSFSMVFSISPLKTLVAGAYSDNLNGPTPTIITLKDARERYCYYCAALRELNNLSEAERHEYETLRDHNASLYHFMLRNNKFYLSSDSEITIAI
ncbi:MAG: hypothetical protein LBJ95_01600 [Oscillospiraceae bacterium]|jgi:hypothetical protein|nr:hypothetical protein [Oscillospiraceae bacterium]